MKPSQLSTSLRRIASKIDNSNNPDRTLVAQDLTNILATISQDSDAPGSRSTRQRIIAEYVTAELESNYLITEDQMTDVTELLYELLSGTNFDFLEPVS